MGLLEAHAGLAGRRAAVIGGAFGIGRAVTLALATAGVDIAVCDFDEQALRSVEPEVKARGRRVLCVHVHHHRSVARRGNFFCLFAGKAANSNFSRAMAVELAAEGIRVNV